MQNNIEEKLREIINKHVETNVDVLTMPIDENLFSVGMDSVSAIKIIVEIEDEFNFEIEDDELSMNNLTTIEKIVAFIESKCSSDSLEN
ncbi:MAG: acyl carrier protein [Lutisporaceae bacterium]